MKKSLLAFTFLFFIFSAFSQSVFINEIHYDNDGGDTDEGVEIAGPAGTDLTGWSLVGYNGNGEAVYSTTNLSGTIPNQMNGYGTLWFAIAGLQNGDPDGIALVDPTSNVVLFLSYEGAFTAADGPASGMESTDIGVQQASSTPIGLTLQLSGEGTDYTDFTWEGPVAETRGNVNLNQMLGTDEDPPEWTTDFPVMQNVLDTKGNLHVSLNEPGTVYYVVLADGATAPTSEEVKAGVDYGGVEVLVAGSIDVAEAETEYVETIPGATPETPYDIYVVAEDKASTPNLQAAPVLLEVTTTAGRMLTIVAPEAGDTYYVGDEVIFQWTSGNIAHVMIGGYDFTGGEYFFLADENTGEPFVIDAALGQFAYTIPNFASTEQIDIRIFDAADTTFYDKVYPVYLVDEVDPALYATYPGNGAVDVPLNIQLVAAFDEEVYAGTGNVVIKNADNTVFESFDIAAAGPGESLEIEDNLLYIRAASSFAQLKKYFVEMDAGVVVDFKDNPFPGISGMDTWSFTTTAVPAGIFFDDFNGTDLSPWENYNVSGATKEWHVYADTVARMNGYDSGDLEEDWLVSPAIDLTNYTGVFLLFDIYKKFGFDDADNYLKLFYSTDFTGDSANLGTATWTEISFDYPSSEDTWKRTDTLAIPDLETTVYFAFKYHYSSGNYRDWRIDNFTVAGYAPVGSDASLSDLLVDGTTVEGFDPAKTDYTMILPAGTTTPPEVTFTLNDPEASAYVTDAADLTGDAAERTSTVTVTASDQTTTRVYSIRFDPILEVADLAALRAATDFTRVYKVTGEVIVTAIVPYNNQKYMQDASGGIHVFDEDGVITTTYNEGDGITGLTGTLEDYYGMLELFPYEDPGAASSTGNTVDPQVISINELNTNFEDYEAELVKVEGVSFPDADGSAEFANGEDYEITVGAESAIVRVHFYNTTVTGAVIPAQADVQGIAIWHYDEAKISPRYIEDITDVTSTEKVLSGQLRIYPTPVSDILYLENIRGVNTLEVLDVTGSRMIMRNVQGENAYRLDVSTLPRGIYFIRLNMDQETLARKIIKN
ncbi:MAG TPA: T9SS type A sorting domain-containing protein [Bacteroidetes bacterium]|nr:T9SS type A sorting domain-containing protein [Bacteroidota bacterium]